MKRSRAQQIASAGIAVAGWLTFTALSVHALVSDDHKILSSAALTAEIFMLTVWSRRIYRAVKR